MKFIGMGKRFTLINIMQRNLHTLIITKNYLTLCTYTWTVKGEYLYSNKMKKYLHRYVMEFYYGKEAIEEANKKNFVVDHIDNNSFNCRVSNLCFIPNNLNKAKGLTFDKRRIEMKDNLTLTFYKDFSTGQFQITIAFHKEFFYIVNEKAIQVDKAYFVYEDDFELVLNDAGKILQQVNKNGEFDENKLSCKNMLYYPSTYIKLKPEEKGCPVIERDGKQYLILNEHTRLGEIPPDKNLYDEDKI
ncbi:HNH endonuclease [Bacillus vallismortis]|uniref:HNH endonuclease n=1 Tax=Bacillus vallismortis TaxID=72361 RepID=UPI000C2AC5B6|nr:HNH endonuclease [Bacillus vallismortis]PJY99741.1 hypothetical protein CPT06_12320 [Bacillus vallismortis]